MAEQNVPTGVADPEVPAAVAEAVTKQLVDPWSVSGEVGVDGITKAINYLSLVEQFGTQRITPELISRFEKVTGHKAHRFIRRGIVFSHRDLNHILDLHERGEKFFMYTGRGPSSDSMHIGHSVPFEFTKWLQNVFDVPLIIMMTDDEKFLFSEKRTIEEVQAYTISNAKDIIAVGFDPKKTFMFSDYEYMGGAFYKNVSRMSKCITLNVARACFGFGDSDNVGKYHFAAIQGATSFASSFPHIFGEDESETKLIPSLIPCAIDQDPYFRLTRDIAPRMHCAKPALIHARFLDALQGPGSKMSASIDTSAIFMKDTAAEIKKKISKYAFSGGRETVDQQRELGGNPEVDVSFQYLKFFLENDEELEKLRLAYIKGELLTGELKAKCISELQIYVKGFQERRAAVNDEVVKDFFACKKLKWTGNPNPIKVAVTEKPSEAPATGEGGVTKNQQKKLDKEKQQEEKKRQKTAEKAAKQAEKAAREAGVE